MCITNLSQLNAAYLLNAGGCTSITAQLADLLKRQQRRCTLDTENSIVREGDGFEYRVCLNTLKVTLLNGAITTADNSALCYLQRVPMKGYVMALLPKSTIETPFPPALSDGYTRGLLIGRPRAFSLFMAQT